jgi:hypothetical protein
LDKTDFEGEAMAPEAPRLLSLQLPFGIELLGKGASAFLVANPLGATGCDGNGTVALP